MRLNKTIQVFEYDFLCIGESGFEEAHWKALAIYNEEYGGDFFRLTHNGVKFQQYVGVLQVAGLTIEILPKIGKDAALESKAEWQKALIDMLRECNWMKIHSHQKASLQFKYNSILEAYLEIFIQECETLLRQGLIKKYRTEDGNCKALKGKLLFGKNIQKNLVHQENFFVRHQVYDRNNLYNQILFKALKLIPIIIQSPLLKDRVYSLLLSFPEVDDIQVNSTTFQNLVFNRKSDAYQEAISIAAMLLLNYRPDISSGHNHVLALLFDMNDLWEEYIFRQIHKHNKYNWQISPQDEKCFWKQGINTQKHIKPDIVISNDVKTVIIDTKWKLPDNNIPADADLKQMFVYNEYWDGISAVLLYPHADYREEPIFNEGEFESISNIEFYKKNVNEIDEPLVMHKCGVMKISVLNMNKALDQNLGLRINKYISKIFQ
jgi:5-methylcytosine-specific restriction enzyme subunit McrC